MLLFCLVRPRLFNSKNQSLCRRQRFIMLHVSLEASRKVQDHSAVTENRKQAAIKAMATHLHYAQHAPCFRSVATKSLLASIGARRRRNTGSRRLVVGLISNLLRAILRRSLFPASYQLIIHRYASSRFSAAPSPFLVACIGCSACSR